MNSWKQLAVFSAIALAAAGGQAAGKAKQQEDSQAAPPPANTVGYGVKMGGYFTEKHEEAAKKAFAQHYAKSKECPKDMERQPKSKSCRSLVQGHYWAVGQTLRKEVETFELPDEVQARLPKPPEGYEYVRALDDVLLLSKGLHLVVDVMENVAAG